MHDRAPSLRDAAAMTFDVIIVGGGINGAGIARDAAERGLRVLLLDRHDWGFGTTWRSSKLIHGGLRYLQYGEVPLVFESLRERRVLLQTAPHLVRPLPFLLPVYRGDAHGRLALEAGLTLYDALASGGGLPGHHHRSAAQARQAEPSLRAEGLRGAFGYWDAQVALPERLCWENVRAATDAGAVALAYVEVVEICRARGRVSGVMARDSRSGDQVELCAPVVVNAAGPWVDRVLSGLTGSEPRLGGTRGTHIVVRFGEGAPRHAIYSEAASDHRPFFILPWRGVHLIGTTDIRVRDPDESAPSDDEIEYLLAASRAVVPGASLRDADVWYAYAGIRPLPRTPSGNEGAITRRHHIVDHRADGADGLISIVGGKLSTYRSLAEEATDEVVRRCGAPTRPCATRRCALVPGNWRPSAAPRDTYLWAIYGPRAEQIRVMERRTPAEAQPLCAHTRDSIAQVRHALRTECAHTIADVLLRRLPTGWSKCLGIDAVPSVVTVMQADLMWTPERAADEVRAYYAELRRTFRRSATLTALAS